ncbi:MAG: hypothetical protein IH881_06125 [Myxococcales bacterium]|nr:hypothetical protein [Myxococcales bacterium]MCH7867257.1 hypothetical protein [Myxococcales bacterium]
MSTTLFDHAADQLESNTPLSRLEARGTLRIALKDAGLDVNNLTLNELSAVFEKLMPAELEARGIDCAATTCTAVMAEITRTADTSTAPIQNSDSVFRRLGGVG